MWRLSYGIGLIPIFFMLLWRLFRLKESKVWIRKRSSLKMMGEWEAQSRAIVLQTEHWAQLK